jgi:hypothetical protein
MRVQLVIALTAMIAVSSAAAAAQNTVAAAGNQVAASAAQKPESAKPKKATKPAGEKICKRLSQGKVCMTAEQWKAYQEQF